MRTAGCELPDWMLHLKKERRKSHNKAVKQIDALEQNKEQVLGKNTEQGDKASKEKVVQRQKVKS